MRIANDGSELNMQHARDAQKQKITRSGYTASSDSPMHEINRKGIDTAGHLIHRVPSKVPPLPKMLIHSP